MHRLGEAALLLGFSAAMLTSPACTTNHDSLARRPSGGSSGGGAGGSSGFGAGGFGNSGNEAQGGRVNPDDEQPGDDVLTIVNGIVDAPRIRLCFARLTDDGQTSELVGSPSLELGYATSQVVTELPDLSFVDDAIQPWVIAGDLDQIEGSSCAEAVEAAQAAEAAVTPEPEPEPAGEGGAAGAGGVGGAGGADDSPEPPAAVEPELRARALAALPPGTVAIGRSILMVLSGCLGGATYTDPLETAVCGPDYAPSTPTAQPIVVKLSRDLRFDKVGLQGLHASQAIGSVDIRASGDAGAVALVFASGVSYGSIGPRPADTRFSPLELGVEQSDYGLQAIGESAEVVVQKSWNQLRESSGIAQVTASRTYTAILLGPMPNLIRKGWWNPTTFALVDNDPTRE